MKGYKVFNTKGDPSSYGIIVAPTYGKAKYRAYLLCSDVWDNVSITDFRAIRAPAYDGIAELSKSVFTKEYADQLLSQQKRKVYAPIVREFRGYIVLAQNERDYLGKARKIANGDRNGFYTIDAKSKIEFIATGVKS